MPHNDAPTDNSLDIEPVLPGDPDFDRYSIVDKPGGGHLILEDGEVIADTTDPDDWLTLEEAFPAWDAELGGATNGFTVSSDADGSL